MDAKQTSVPGKMPDIWLCVAVGFLSMVTHAGSFYAGYFNLPELLSHNRNDAFDKDFYIRPVASLVWAIGYAFFVFRIARYEARWLIFRNILAFIAAFGGIVLTFTFYERGSEIGFADRLKATGGVSEISSPGEILKWKNTPGYLTINGGTIDNPNALSGEYRMSGSGGTARNPGSKGYNVSFTLLPILGDPENDSEMIRIFLFMNYGLPDGQPAYKHRVRGYVRRFKAGADRKFESLQETFDAVWQAKDQGIAKVLSEYPGALPETVLVLDNTLLQDGGFLGFRTLAGRFGIIALLTGLLVLLQWTTRLKPLKSKTS